MSLVQFHSKKFHDIKKQKRYFLRHKYCKGSNLQNIKITAVTVTDSFLCPHKFFGRCFLVFVILNYSLEQITILPTAVHNKKEIS